MKNLADALAVRRIQTEITMSEFAERKAVEQDQPADTAMRQDGAKKQALHFMLGAQRMVLEEMAFAAYAMLDRVRSETRLFGELAAKLASSHSVRDLNAMGRDCG